MPRKVFTAGEVLTAANVQTFLADQSVMTFASSAARGSAIPTPIEGMLTYLADTNTYETYDGAAFVELIDPDTLISPMTTRGDIITAGTAGVPERLAIGETTYVLTSNGATPFWSAPEGGGGGELFWLIEANQLARIDLVIPANQPFLIKAYGSPAGPNPSADFFSVSDVNLLSATDITQSGTEGLLATAVDYFIVANSGATPVWIVVTAPESLAPTDSLKIFSLLTTQSVVLDRSYDAFVFGGGGAGGGISGRNNAGGGGGGSGFYATGIIAAGTYTATVGASGGGGYGNGGTGGSSSIGAISAAGGSGGLQAAGNSVGGAGGAGGSGGAGGVGNFSGVPGLGGFQGSNGAAATGSGTNGAGGAGSGVAMPNPIQALNVALLIPALAGVSNLTPAGVYGGGGGRNSVFSSGAHGTGTNARAGGGGGAGAGTYSSDRVGGSGGSGIIILIERP